MNHPIQITLDDLGRIFIPASLRKRLGLKPGMMLVVENAEQDGVQLRVQEEPSGIVEKEGFLVFAGEPLGDITNLVQDERARRNQELIRRAGL